jgi:hypothetical protein
MPKTLSTSDPNLVKAVQRLGRSQKLWGVLLIALGFVTELAATSNHPVAGLPFIAVGLLAFRWAEPALLATVAVVMAFSIVPTINPRLTLLGPDPIAALADLRPLELGAVVVGKGLIVLTAANQFFLYRFLYGTARASAADPDLAIIPAMVPNRTDGLSRSARLIAIVAILSSVLGFIFSLVDPAAFPTHILAELGGSLGVVAFGFGLGCAFSPTNERSAALLGVQLGLLAYAVAVVTLATSVPV